jgi:hypothetical protein
VKHATLTHRGESFEFLDEDDRFVGECVWAWEEEPGAIPRRVYPITLFVQSIRRLVAQRSVRVPAAQRAAIAREVKAMLEAREAGCSVLLEE